MSLPSQRDTSGPDTGGWRILEAVNRVDDSVRGLAADMATRFDQLDRRFMPREQVVDRFETVHRDHNDLRSQVDQGKTRHELDVERLEKAVVDAEEARRKQREADEIARQTRAREETKERRTVRLALGGLALTAVGTVATVIALLPHIHF